MEAIIVAVITAFSAVAVALINKGRKELRSSRDEIRDARAENARDHGIVRDALGRIESKIDSHINDHAVGKFEEGSRRAS
jgi:ribosome recycling factor